MTGPTATMLADGRRLHLSHGPMDLILEADGTPQAVEAAYRAARARFDPLLEELVDELPGLRAPAGQAQLTGPVACRMAAAVAPFAAVEFITPMAAVAGAVAQEVLSAMTRAAPLTRAYVNNGGDIALHLAPGQSYAIRVAGPQNDGLGQIRLAAQDRICGIATSGRGGRSHSLGIADSVTVLARSAALADAAATLIGNAVDLPGHAAIRRAPASDLSPDSDLGARPVVTGCGPLSHDEVARALAAGHARASRMQARGLIAGAALFLRGQARVLSPTLKEVFADA